MKPRYVFLIFSILVTIFVIILIMIKGHPPDKVSFDSLMEVFESVLHHIDKTGHILTSVTDQEEMQIGDGIADEVSRNFSFIQDKDVYLTKYIIKVGREITRNVKRENIIYKFHVVEDDYDLNAFALPGGHVYITTGLLKALKSEAELTWVLGHEITHIDAKHCIEAIQYKIAVEKIVGANIDTFIDIGYRIFLTPGYSEFNEREADKGGVYLAYLNNYHPLAAISALEGLKDYKSSKSNYEPITPIGDTIQAAGKVLGRYFNTHPPIQNRMEYINKYIAESKLINGKRKFYIGKKNYNEKKSYKETFYPDELKNEYVLTD